MMKDTKFHNFFCILPGPDIKLASSLSTHNKTINKKGEVVNRPPDCQSSDCFECLNTLVNTKVNLILIIFFVKIIIFNSAVTASTLITAIPARAPCEEILDPHVTKSCHT